MMTTTELIAKLQKIVSESGDLTVCIEAKAFDLDYMDEGGNHVNELTMSAEVGKCEVDVVAGSPMKKGVWLVGNVEPTSGDTDDVEEL
jgi:hypothetical protein